ncbi:TPA_asm: hypothetical protein vir526_00004 [Caudoviricetes sp. vir526]|nr:TPA_asm: hypothetical protein vir526_00004 [Caudoviricetes sp. vir526]
MEVENMTNRNGNKVPNQFIIIDDDENILFQSYNTIIAKIDGKNGKIFLDANYWDYSKTTGKYRNIFLNESKKETEKKIKSGEYELVDLN